MESVSKHFVSLGPAGFVLKALLVAIAANLLLLGFIFFRRSYRKRFFRKRDARLLDIQRDWDRLISGAIPYESWRRKPFDLRIIETVVLDKLESADREEATRLLKFLRASRLIEKLIFEARQHTGWRKNRALVALGRTRAPEGIPALAEALRDRDLETRLAAIRGLGRMACPEAGDELLNSLMEAGLQVPALPLQSALVQCCSERPRMLLKFLQNSETPVRRIIGRVMGEVAVPSLGNDLLPFVHDEEAELRAAAARALPCCDANLALEALTDLVNDPVWFVRLRAVVSLGKVADPATVPPLLRCLRDPNRLIRLRSAEAILKIKKGQAEIFHQVLAAQDKYALHAYLTALDNNGFQEMLREEITRHGGFSEATKSALLQALRIGDLHDDRSEKVKETALARAAGTP
jgi:HEAT repeat protein